MLNDEIIQSKIAKKQAEIISLEKKLADARVYVQALKDVLSDAEKEDAEKAAAEGSIRKGSTVDVARSAILEAGRSLHLDDILKRMGREVTRETKASLNGSLAAYYRKGQIFTRPKPSTYGLIELEDAQSESKDEPPEGFGGGERYALPPDLDDEIPF